MVGQASKGTEERQGGLGKQQVGNLMGVGTKCVGLHYVPANVCQRPPSTEEVLNSVTPCGGEPCPGPSGLYSEPTNRVGMEARQGLPSRWLWSPPLLTDLSAQRQAPSS